MRKIPAAAADSSKGRPVSRHHGGRGRGPPLLSGKPGTGSGKDKNKRGANGHARRAKQNQPQKIGGHPWIRDRLRLLQDQGKDKTQAGLASAMGVAKARINEMIDGGTWRRTARPGRSMRRISAADVPVIAAYLEMAPLDIIGKIIGETLLGSQERQCLVRGLVEAGTFRVAPQKMDAQARAQLLSKETGGLARPSPLTVDPRFPDAEQVVFEVADGSCGDVYPPGSFLLTVGLEDLARRPRAGDHVIVESRRGDSYEFTCQQVLARETAASAPYVAPLPGGFLSQRSTHGARPVALVIAAHIKRTV